MKKYSLFIALLSIVFCSLWAMSAFAGGKLIGPGGNAGPVLISSGPSSGSSTNSAFSKYWAKDGKGAWHIYDHNGNMLKSCWLCDDAVPANGKNVWYLIDENGNMVSNGLVQDMTGNYYSLETNPSDSHYGMLRYISGEYDGIHLDLVSTFGSYFGALTNNDGIEALKAKYDVRVFNIDNSNCVYTSNLEAAEREARRNLKASENAIYVFEGKRYMIDYDWGQHYLTGYGPSDTAGTLTRSGKYATIDHTVAGPYALLGRTCMIIGASGMEDVPDYKAYNGLYVFEDTGDEAVETGKETTMGVPVVDIFRGSADEADKVTRYGWITANVYIMKEVQ